MSNQDKISIFSELPTDIINIINSFSYGPYELKTFNQKRKVNEEILCGKIWLNILNDKVYEKIPELFEYNNDIWFDYLNGLRIPKLVN